MHGRSSKKRTQGPDCGDEATGVRQMSRHIKVKKCSDFEYEGSEDKIFERAVNNTPNSRRKMSKIVRNKKSTNCQDNTAETCKEVSKDIKKENLDGTEKSEPPKDSEQKKKAKVKRIKCSYEGCIKEFNATSNLKKHVDSVHLNIRKYLCEFCVSCFKTSNALKIHIAAFHTKKENRKFFVCKICGKTLLGKAGLRLHETLHAADKNYPCSFEGCGKSFRLKQYLSRHELCVHKGVKHHQCEVCDEKFSRKVYLRTHMYKHTGIKSFSCETCGKFFSQRGNLKTHMLIHNRERPKFSCPQCFQTFTFKSNLTKHLQGHVKEEEEEEDLA